jgi:hypothetical protein
VGVDLTLEENLVVILDEQAKRLDRFTFPQDRGGYEYFFRRVEGVRQRWNASAGGGIDRARGVVQDQDSRIGQEGACNRQALALSTGEGNHALTDDRLITFFELADELVSLGGTGCGFNLFLRGSGSAKGNIFRHRTRKEKDILFIDGYLVAQGGQIPVPDIHPVDEDLSARGIIGAIDWFYQRCPTGTGLPDDGHSLPGLDYEGNVAQHSLTVRIGKSHVAKLNLAMQGLGVAGCILVQVGFPVN